MFQRIVLFGASGDLTARLLMPGIAQLAAEGLLPDGFSIVGSSTRDWTSEEFRERMAAALDLHAAGLVPEVAQAVVGKLDFRSADVTNPVDVRAVVGNVHEPTLVYLALPTDLLERALLALSRANLTGDDSVAIEKPFGTSLASARRLNEILRSALNKPAIYRIDHILADELVRRTLALRFSNRVFEPLLNARHVERVDVSWLETLTLEGRAAYYDRAGALKDAIQNHFLQALSLVVLEQPVGLDHISFGESRVEALRAVATPTPEMIRTGTVRGRYTAGTIGTRVVPAYVDEPGVDAARNTETYAAVELEMRNPRWDGTRFTLRHGKALALDTAEIAIHFKQPRDCLGSVLLDPAPNILRIGLMEPYVRLETVISEPGSIPAGQALAMVTPKPRRTAYANLLAGMLSRTPALFVRGDEAEEAWRIFDPIANAWANDEVPMQEYPAGGELPVAS
jgi:glucose-6-phosphate 1-dehydrogenase